MAARLQQAARPGQALISASIGEGVVTSPVGALSLKGVDVPVRAFVLLDLTKP